MALTPEQRARLNAPFESLTNRPAPEPPPPQGGFFAGMKSAMGQTLAGTGRFAEEVLGAEDTALRRYGQRVVEANPTRVQGFGDFAENPLTGTKEFVGTAAGSVAEVGGAMAAGSALQRIGGGMQHIPHPLAQRAGRGVEMLGKGVSRVVPWVVGAPKFFESTRQIQEETGEENIPLAVGVSLGAGMLGRFLGPERMLADGATRQAGESARRFVARSAARSGAQEMFEEGVQNPVIQWAGGLNPFEAAQLQDTAFGMFAGGIGGAGVGAPLALTRQTGPGAARDEGDDAPDPPTQVSAATPAPVAPQPSVLDLINQNTGVQADALAGAPRSSRDSAFADKLPEPMMIVDEQGRPKRTTSALEAYEFERDFVARSEKARQWWANEQAKVAGAPTTSSVVVEQGPRALLPDVVPTPDAVMTAPDIADLRTLFQGDGDTKRTHPTLMRALAQANNRPVGELITTVQTLANSPNIKESTFAGLDALHQRLTGQTLDQYQRAAEQGMSIPAETTASLAQPMQPGEMSMQMQSAQTTAVARPAPRTAETALAEVAARLSPAQQDYVNAARQIIEAGETPTNAAVAAVLGKDAAAITRTVRSLSRNPEMRGLLSALQSGRLDDADPVSDRRTAEAAERAEIAAATNTQRMEAPRAITEDSDSAVGDTDSAQRGASQIGLRTAAERANDMRALDAAEAQAAARFSEATTEAERAQARQDLERIGEIRQELEEDSQRMTDAERARTALSEFDAEQQQAQAEQNAQLIRQNEANIRAADIIRAERDAYPEGIVVNPEADGNLNARGVSYNQAVEAKTVWDGAFAGQSEQSITFARLGPMQQVQVARLVAATRSGEVPPQRALQVLRELKQNFLSGIRESRTTEGAATQTTVQQVMNALTSWGFARERLNSFLTVANTYDALPADARQALEQQVENPAGTQAFVWQGRAYMIADRIEAADIRPVFIHEVGVHMGIPAERVAALSTMVQGWATAPEGSMERQVYDAVQRRLEGAGTREDGEVVAYAVEEALRAGVQPRGTTGVAGWVRQLVDTMRQQVARLLGRAQHLQAQDLVNYAYGAANMVAAGDTVRATEASPQVQQSVAAQLRQNPAVQQARRAIDNLPPEWAGALRGIRDALTKAVYTSSFTRDFADMVRKILPGARGYLDIITRKGEMLRRQEVEIQQIVQPLESLNVQQRRSVDNLLSQSTLKNAWAYQPTWLVDAQGNQITVTVDSALARQYQALPQSARTAIDRMFQHTRESHKRMTDLMVQDLVTRYDDMIANANDPKQVTKLTNERDKQVTRIRHRASLDETSPYLPIRRWGNIAVVAKSEAFRAAEAEAKQSGDFTALDDMKADQNHYRVIFTDGQMSAARVAAEWEAEGFSKPDVSARIDYIRQNDAIPLQLIEQVKQQVSDDTPGAAQIRTSIEQMYVHALEATSIRKSELRRMGVDGGRHLDMVRSFIEHGVGSARLGTSITTMRETASTLANMRNEVRNAPDADTRHQRTLAFNEIMARHALFTNPVQGKWEAMQQRLMGGTSIWMLLSTPSYYMQNATQPYMLTLPTLAARFGYARSAATLTNAYRDVTQAWRSTNNGELLDPAKLNDPHERALAETLIEKGLFDIGITADLGSFGASQNKGMAAVAKAHRKLMYAARVVEMYNRGATALSSFRLAKDAAQRQNKGQPLTNNQIEAAIQYAIKQVEVTQGDYSGVNAPRLISEIPAGRLLFQFRKFQLIQIGLMARTLNGMFAKGVDPTERAIAYKQMSFILGHHMAIGGLMGLPAANLIAPLLALAFGDPEEPKDAEVLVRRAIDDKALADLLLKGAPAALGVDTSARLGMGQMLAVMPFTDIKLSRDGYESAVTALLGPTVGLGGQMVDGLGQMAEGNYWMGTAAMMPRAIRDSMRAYAAKTDGVRRRNGDMVVSPEEISYFDAVMQGVGWPTSVHSDRWMAQTALIRSEEHFNNRAKEVRRSYTDAFDKGDRDSMQEAIRAWHSLQAARVNYGFKRQPVSNLTRAPREKTARERDSLAGVPVRDSNRQFVESLLR